MKLWSVAKLDKTKAGEIQSRYELPAIVAMLLQIRNITTKDEIESFLYNDSFIADPFEIKDMDKAVERIKRLIAVNRFVFTVIMMPTVSPQQHFYILTLKQLTQTQCTIFRPVKPRATE